jgi:hypothetical protein
MIQGADRSNDRQDRDGWGVTKGQCSFNLTVKAMQFQFNCEDIQDKLNSRNL